MPSFLEDEAKGSISYLLALASYSFIVNLI